MSILKNKSSDLQRFNCLCGPRLRSTLRDSLELLIVTLRRTTLRLIAWMKRSQRQGKHCRTGVSGRWPVSVLTNERSHLHFANLWTKSSERLWVRRRYTGQLHKREFSELWTTLKLDRNHGHPVREGESRSLSIGFAAKLSKKVEPHRFHTRPA